MRRACIIAAVFCASAAPVGMGRCGEPIMIIDFAEVTEGWPSIDDAVMGGVSSSGMVIENGIASFRGDVSFDNNGGFASVRSQLNARDLSAFDGLILKVRGDGKRYGFRIRTNASFDGVSYEAPMAPPAGQWTEVAISFSDFVAVWRGRPVADHPPLDPAGITTFGLIISRQEGPFRLDVAWIRAMRQE